MKKATLLVMVGCFFFTARGHPLGIPFTDHSHCAFDVLILLDTSGSITENNQPSNWGNVLLFAKTLVSDIDKLSHVGEETRIGVISYSEAIHLDAGLDAAYSKTELISVINDIQYQGQTTRMFQAVTDARDHFLANRRRTSVGTTVLQILILFTDGIPYSFTFDNETSENAQGVLRGMMDSGIHVVMVGVGNYDMAIMREVDNYGNRMNNADLGRFIEASDFEDLRSEEFATQVLDPLDMGCERVPSGCKMDILLLIDSSGSIGKEMFDTEVKPFVEKLVSVIDEKSPISPTGTRVGATIFSNEARTLIALSDGTSYTTVLNAVSTMHHMDSWTHMVQYATEAWDQLQANRRPGVPARLVIITDGVPEHADNADENVDNLIASLRNMSQADPPIKITFVGFKGTKEELQMNSVMERMQTFTDTYNATSGLADFVANNIVETFGLDCPAQDVLAMCPTDLVFVLDDTSPEKLAETRQIANHLINDQLKRYVDETRVRVQVFDSQGSVAISELGTVVMSDTVVSIEVNPEVRRLPFSNDNALLKSLNLAYEHMMSVNGRYKAVVVIHSGELQFDSSSMDDPLNSLLHVAYNLIKRSLGADIYSLLLSSTTPHGLEVLRRLHSVPSPLLTADSNLPALINQFCLSPLDSACESIDAVFLLDVSHSSDLPAVRAQALEVLALLHRDYASQARVAIVSFAEYPCVHVDLENGQLRSAEAYELLKRVISGLMPSIMPMTNMAAALETLASRVFNSHGDRLMGTNHLFIFSDLGANMHTFAHPWAFNRLDDAVQSVLVIQPPNHFSSPYTDTTLLQLPVVRLDELDAVFQSELTARRDCPKNDLVQSCRHMIIVADSSGSLTDQGRTGYTKVQDFQARLVHAYYSAPRPQQMAVVQFSYIVKTLIELGYYGNTYASPDGAMSIILGAEHLNGLTNLEIAFDRALEITAGMDKSSFAFVLISDGETNRGRNGTMVLHDIVEQGYQVLGVFLTNTFSDSSRGMRQMVPDEYELYLEEFIDLQDQSHVDWVINHLCGS